MASSAQQLSQGGARLEQSRFAVRVPGRWDQPPFSTTLATLLDLPVVVVQQEMVVLAE
jgi:hypothetical protein